MPLDAYKPATGAPALAFRAPWTETPTVHYRPAWGAAAIVPFKSLWSEMVGPVQQEREVLSAIGGAEPFLHLYEARRRNAHGLSVARVGQLARDAGHDSGSWLAYQLGVGDGTDDDRVFIESGVTYAQMQDDGLNISVYLNRGSDDPTVEPITIMLAGVNPTDPDSGGVVYYERAELSIPLLAYSSEAFDEIRLTASGDTLTATRYLNNTPGAVLSDTIPQIDDPRIVIRAMLPQNDQNQLSRIQYRHQRADNWYYYHGIAEVYVSDPISIVADEEAMSYNGRDSAIEQSPPHVPYFSAVVRQHQSEPRAWFEELLARDQVITGQRVHMLLRDSNENYGKDSTGILQTPQFQHEDNVYTWRVTANDPTSLMVQSFSQDETINDPSDATTLAEAIERVARDYAAETELEYEDVVGRLVADEFPTRLAWFWTDFESQWPIFQRLVNTMGPPASFYVNNLGQLIFNGNRDRNAADRTPVVIGGNNGIPIARVVSYTDHITDVVNDARLPVSLHGWILPEQTNDPEHIGEKPQDWMGAEATPDRQMVRRQLFENYQDTAIFNLAGGHQVVFNDDGEYRYRIRTSMPVLPHSGPTYEVVGSSNVTVTQHAANILEIVATGNAGDNVPTFQVFGAMLQNFRNIEAWASPEVVAENETGFSRYLYRRREFQYSGYSSVDLNYAQNLADWIVRYYRRGIKTMTLQLFCSGDPRHVQDALRLVPDQYTPVTVNGYGDAAPEQWLVRSARRIYRDGHMWVDVVIDEDIMHTLGLNVREVDAATAAAFMPTARYSVDDGGALTFTAADGSGLVIPQRVDEDASPDLAVTVIPIARSSGDPQIVRTFPGGDDLFVLDAGQYRAAHFDLTLLEALDGSRFWAPGLRANGISLWLVDKKGAGNYWAVASFNIRSNAYAGSDPIPGMIHFLRVRYFALGASQDVVLSFVTPPTTVLNPGNQWLTVAQEQPWLDEEDAGAALQFNQRVLLLEWRSYPVAGLGTRQGEEDSGVRHNSAVVSRNAETTANVGLAVPGQTQVTRRMGVS